MQQTDKYQLNLIETSDPFSPGPLNENMERVEAQLDAVRTEAANAADALDQRLQVFEARRFAMGTYSATSGVTDIEITLDFTPEVVFIHALNGSSLSGMLYPVKNSEYYPHIVPNGFLIPKGQSSPLNYQYSPYLYLAFG